MCLFVFAKHGMDIYEQGLILDVFTGQFYETCQEYVFCIMKIMGHTQTLAHTHTYMHLQG